MLPQELGVYGSMHMHQLLVNLEKLKRDGDILASEIQKKLRIVVGGNGTAGGDGTAGWILGVISDLTLAQPPPVATVPLGTGNNLLFAFGWTMGFDQLVIPNDSTDQLAAESLPVDTQEMQVEGDGEQFADIDDYCSNITRVNDMYAVLKQPGCQDERLKALQLLKCHLLSTQARGYGKGKIAVWNDVTQQLEELKQRAEELKQRAEKLEHRVDKLTKG
ncbi:diacylglycerol kinase 5-like protein [Tanacetum coccineum]